MIDGTSDVLVVGAGPSGSAAATLAARHGASVCVVDRARFPRPKVCGDAISNSALELLTALAGDEAASAAPRAVVSGATAIFPDGGRVRRSYGQNPGAIIERVDFDDVLRRGAERAGATVHEGVTVRQLVRDGRCFTGAEGPGFRWRARAVVVADGTASVAWDALGLAAPAPSALGISATAYYEGLRPSVDPGYSEHYFERSLPTGYGWVFPEVHGRSNVGVYLRVDRYRAGGVNIRKLLSDFVLSHPERFEGARAVGSVRTWSLPLAGFRRVASAPGLLVCGDAARLIDPLTGEGIWHAMRSGMLAGAAAASVVSGVDPSTVERRYRAELAREVAWPTASRRALEAVTTFVVASGIYRAPLTRRILEWGYNRRGLEVSKTTGGRAHLG